MVGKERTEMITIQDLQSKCESVLKTLPLAHYLKVDTIPVAFDTNADTSYFDPAQFRIVVAFNNIGTVIVNSKKSYNDLELEKTIRCFLYHEVSHAIMTPKDLMYYARQSSIINPQLANILEDERIETTLKKYYYGVDFKENLRNASPLDKQIQSFEHFVFNAVRHRCSPIMPKQVNRLVNDFITATMRFTASNGCDLILRAMELLVKKLRKIFDLLPKATQPQQKGNQSQNNNSSNGEEDSSSTTEDKTQNTSNKSSQSESNDTNEESEDNSSEEESGSTEENEDDESTDSSQEESDDETENGGENGESSEEETNNAQDDSLSENDELKNLCDNAKEMSDVLDNELSNEDIEKSISKQMFLNKQESSQCGGYKMKISDFQYEKDTKVELLKIIGRNAGFGINQTPVQFGYSGKFNTKRFATDFNDSCKWFAKRAYEDTGVNNKRNNTKVLNIWLDNSGSYSRNDYGTNLILSALASIEDTRKDFKFNLITFGDDFHEKSGEDRISSSHEGTTINEKAPKLYRKYNPTQSELNIFLIDGKISEFGRLEIDNAINDLKKHREKVLKSNEYSQEQKENFKQYVENNINRINSMSPSGYENLKDFNNKRTIFISERSNEEGIERVCPSATLIIENNDYTGKLKQNIIKAFDLLF